MLNLNRLAIIPARGGSKRIKNKNLVNFNGKPIVEYTIDNAKKSKLFDKIHISTNCNKILNYLKKRKISPDFKRLKKYAGDNIGLQDTLRFVVNEYKKRQIFFKEIWLLYACAPLITHKDLISASKEFQKTKKEYPMMSVTEFNVPIEWAFRKKNKIFIPINKKSLTLRSQDIKKSFHESASFIIFKKSQLYKSYNFKYYGYELKKKYAIDIDTEEDLDIARALHKYNKVKNKG